MFIVQCSMFFLCSLFFFSFWSRLIDNFFQDLSSLSLFSLFERGLVFEWQDFFDRPLQKAAGSQPAAKDDGGGAEKRRDAPTDAQPHGDLGQRRLMTQEGVGRIRRVVETTEFPRLNENGRERGNIREIG